MALPTMAPRKFGRYEVQKPIGDGAMGRVYRAFDPLVNRVVAIKTVQAETLANETRAEYLRRFRQEAHAAGRLSHPGIVSVFDVGDDFIVMELLDGITLAELLADRTPTIEEALDILGPVADAIDYAHQSGVVHRDIKPGNIMVLPNGRPKLMDFGVARLDSGKVSAGEGYFGSPCYMAPEQIRSGDVTGRADLFSFGVVAYETLTGHRPFNGDSITAIVHRVVHEDPPPPRSLRPDLPPAYDAIFAHALAKDPARRFPSAMAFVSALEAEAPSAREAVASRAPLELESGLHTIPARPFEPPAAKRPIVRPAVLAAAFGAAALGALVTAVILLPRERFFLGRAGAVELRIETEPEGASIWVDGLAAGKSPLALKGVAPGPHLVRVAAEGYAAAELKLHTVAGMTTPPLRFVLAPSGSLLAVRTVPPGATARLDGRHLGVTPLEAGFVKPGPHELRLELKGHLPQVRRIEAEAGRPLLVQLRLQEAPPVQSGAEPAPAKPAASSGALPVPPLVEGVLVPLDASVTAPRKIFGDSAPYPEAARRLKLEGSVTVEMTVTEGGAARDVRVLESAGAILDEAVVAAVSKWRYEPALKQGIRVRVRLKYRQTFRPAG